MTWRLWPGCSKTAHRISATTTCDSGCSSVACALCVRAWTSWPRPAVVGLLPQRGCALLLTWNSVVWHSLFGDTVLLKSNSFANTQPPILMQLQKLQLQLQFAVAKKNFFCAVGGTIIWTCRVTRKPLIAGTPNLRLGELGVDMRLGVDKRWFPSLGRTMIPWQQSIVFMLAYSDVHFGSFFEDDRFYKFLDLLVVGGRLPSGSDIASGGT